jgi:hypothetical protein
MIIAAREMGEGRSCAHSLNCTEVMFVILDNVPEVDRGTALLIHLFVTTLSELEHAFILMYFSYSFKILCDLEITKYKVEYEMYQSGCRYVSMKFVYA